MLVHIIAVSVVSCKTKMGIQTYLADVESVIAKEAENDDEMNMLVYYIAGVIHYKIAEYDKAVECWNKSEKYARKLKSDVYLAKIFSYYAIIYYVEKDFDRSEVYFDEAASIFAVHKMYTELSLHYINYLWYKRYDPDKNEVSSYLDMAFYYVQLSNSIMDARVYLHLGYIYKTIFNDFIRGIGYLNTACLKTARKPCRLRSTMLKSVLRTVFPAFVSGGRCSLSSTRTARLYHPKS